MADLPSLLRDARGPRTVISVAVTSGVSRRSIQHYEAGRIVPPLHLLIDLMDALGCSLATRRAILAAHMAAEAAKGSP